MFFDFVYREDISSVFLIKVVFVWSYDHNASSVVVDPARVLFLVDSYVLLFAIPSKLFGEVVFNSQFFQDLFSEAFVH
jgi:hypothetical protein